MTMNPNDWIVFYTFRCFSSSNMVKARTPPLDIIIVSNRIEISKRKISSYMKASKDYKDRETYALLKTDIKPPITVTEVKKDVVEDFVGLPFV